MKRFALLLALVVLLGTAGEVLATGRGLRVNAPVRRAAVVVNAPVHRAAFVSHHNRAFFHDRVVLTPVFFSSFVQALPAAAFIQTTPAPILVGGQQLQAPPVTVNNTSSAGGGPSAESQLLREQNQLLRQQNEQLRNLQLQPMPRP